MLRHTNPQSFQYLEVPNYESNGLMLRPYIDHHLLASKNEVAFTIPLFSTLLEI